MAGEQEGAARRAQDGIAVSNGDSSAPTPKPALDSKAGTVPSVDATDLTSAGTEPSLPSRQAAASSAPKSDPSDAMTTVSPSSSRGDSSGSPPHPIFSHIGATIFHEGDVIGGRYEIHKMLGMGGMGAVYKARDMEVERVVGLKVIRPDLAGNPAILARFKQELVLARQVTHKNIIRIYDLNEADGVKFITMEFIEGEDLRTILTRQGKLSPAEAVAIMLQVCAGLHCAHSEGVIHRDLKPSNIMRDQAGRVVIMDFGLARTLQGDGMTQTGMMIGTMEYMSPEQAMGKDLDARSDEFAIGLIFYELLSGCIPFHADSAIASLVKRTQERAVPLVDVDAAIPPALSEIVSKCLERDPEARFASVEELANELESWQGKRPRTSQSSLARPGIPAPAPAKRFAWKWLAIGIAAMLVGIGAVVGVRSRSHPGAETQVTQGPVTSLAILPFYNASGDASLNWMGSSIAETLNTDIGQSAHVRTVSPDRLQQVLGDLRVSPASQLDLQTVKRIADYTHADTVVFGQYDKIGDQVRINATVADLANDRSTTVNSDVAGEKQLLTSLDKMADDLRAKLAPTPEVLKELQSHSQHVVTKSIPALRAYDEGSQLARAGDNTQAVEKFADATTQDPSFAMAFSKLAQTYAALGYDDKAEQASRRAVELSDNLPAQDRYLIQAIHAGILHDNDKAVAAYQQLAKINPDDTEAEFALAKLYEDTNNYAEAKPYLAKVLSSDPKYVAALLASGRVDIKDGNPQAALDPLNRALSLAIQFDNQEQKGAILHALGVVYQRLNKPDDALRNYQQALEIRKKVGAESGVASTLGQIAQVQDSLGNFKAAQSSYEEAVEVDRKIGDKKGLTTNLMNLGSLYLDHGQFDQALKNTKEALQIARDTQDEMAQAILLLNIGNAQFNQGEYQDALTYFQQAYDIQNRLKAQDAATESLHNLASTNVKLGQYDTALAQYVKALDASRAANDKSGAARESSDLAAVFAAQGRYDAALKAQQDAVNAYQQLNDRTYMAVDALAGYGRTLSAVGREDEGQKKIEEALRIAVEAKNDATTAEALNYLGDSYFYRGDYPAARQQYQKALQLATKAKARDQMVLANLNLAKLDVAQGRSQTALPALKKLKQDADAMGLKAESVQASIYLGEALLATNHPDAARAELDSAVGRAEKLGLLVDQARAQYLLGNAIAKGGKPAEAVPHYREAVKILETIVKQEGAGRVLERSDLKDLYRAALKSYQGQGGA
jgi:serine/threonine protein kinase/tetratricopeptide (TPR) repeat protein/TolB-like protein